MSLNNLTSKNILYLQSQFPTSVKEILKDYLHEAYIFVLIYLPADNSRKKYREANRLIAHRKYLTIYWYKDPLNVIPGESFYIVKREHRNFVLLWFDLLTQLENSPFIIDIYKKVIRLLKLKHTRYVVVHRNYLMIEDEIFPMHLNHAVNLFL